MKPDSIVVVSMALALSSCAAKHPKAAGLTNVPSLTAPEVRRLWVPEKIDGNRFIDGHYEYLLEKPSVWSK